MKRNGNEEVAGMNEPVDYTDGEWIGATLGHFIGLLVDVGTDPAVIFRVAKDSEADESGQFIRDIEVMVLPNGYVVPALKKLGVERVHKTLAALIEAGIVK